MNHPETRTIFWDNVAVAGNDSVLLTFAAAAGAVDFPDVVVNTAVIHPVGGDSFDRHFPILLLPADGNGGGIPELAGSYKDASRLKLESGEEVQYTITLHNSGTGEAVADVVDQIPTPLNFVEGSITNGGTYDPATRTISWSGVTVPSADAVSLSFVVKADLIDEPSIVFNTAVIQPEGDDPFKRQFPLLLVPSLGEIDVIPPVVNSVTIADKDVLTDRDVTLKISASDNTGVTEMFIRKWHLSADPLPHWEVVQSSGWVPYQENYAWTLGDESGTYFVGVWVADNTSNRSRMNRNALDSASLILPGETVSHQGLIPYLVSYEKGASVKASLTTTSGDADLYVWYPGNIFLPDQKSTTAGTSIDEVNFVTPRSGPYLFVVYGDSDASYDMTITPDGGPQVQTIAAANINESSRLTPNSQANPNKEELAAELILTQSGLDPLGIAGVPDESTNLIFLPLINR
ncbi:DUF11 domain-containing protein [Chloroflexi bacterium TSY]|nr:DUF11 domain-containing protein [Chloroflexi bacterium TSY]